MGVLSDSQIRYLKDIITPFEEKQVSENVVSYGLSSYGYDFRLSNKFKVVKNHILNYRAIMDPKHSKTLMEDKKYEDIDIHPGSFALGMSVEKFKVPRDVLGVCIGKSTYARCGLIVNITPLEPEWEGHITISMMNVGPFIVRVYANEGIAQVLFLRADEVCETSYSDRKGKYNNAKGIMTSKIK